MHAVLQQDEEGDTTLPRSQIQKVTIMTSHTEESVTVSEIVPSLWSHSVAVQLLYRRSSCFTFGSEDVREPVLFFFLQDKVSLISSRLFVMSLPASLLAALAEITKLLVSELRVYSFFVYSRLKSSFSEKKEPGHRMDDADPMDEDWDVSRIQSEEVDQFDEGSSGSSAQKLDTSDAPCGPGMSSISSQR